MLVHHGMSTFLQLQRVTRVESCEALLIGELRNYLVTPMQTAFQIPELRSMLLYTWLVSTCTACPLMKSKPSAACTSYSHKHTCCQSR